MSKKNQKKSSGSGCAPLRWLMRMFMGASRGFASDMEEKQKKSANGVEEIISPGRQVLRNFRERKLAMFALFVVLAMFVFVFVGPLFLTNYSDNYTEVTQKSVPPTMSMMSVPKELKSDIKMISSYGSFTVGLSNAGKVYVWGATQLGTTGIDIADIPEEVRNTRIAMVSAGIDHIIAIGENGKVYGWGSNRMGQYGNTQTLRDNPNVDVMPEEFLEEGGVDVANVKKLISGYQASAILMNDGTLYMWGNKLTYANMDKFAGATGMKDVAFLLNYIVGVKDDGTGIYTGTRGLYTTMRENTNAEAVKTKTFLDGRTIERLIATSDTLCVELSDGSIALSGDFTSDAMPIPELEEGETFVLGSISAGTYHYSGVTTNGRVLSWGKNHFGQSEAPSSANGAAVVYTGAFQNYAVDESGGLITTWGLKGYIFGTDTYGADIFQRICSGGRMTMIIGAVAVIISTIIGIIIGCISGYFGGKIDMLLMRVTEIFTAIPFLPFAMILSSMLSQVNMSENARIFLIMVILGVLTWSSLARLVRGQVLVARESEYVTAAKAMGVRENVIAFKHILPNVISVILVTLTLDFAGCLLTESSLSYLGFGVQYPRPTWGNMLNGANNATIISNYWWQWVFTSLFLAITTICINIVGDTLRDVLDPKSNIDR